VVIVMILSALAFGSMVVGIIGLQQIAFRAH
jgi:hypothetical protein